MKIATLLPALAVACVLPGCTATRSGYASAPYKVVRSDGGFELRDYPQLTLVETSSTTAVKDGNDSFMRLFHFISGRNAAKEKISMTTPVFMSGGGPERTMSFVMPAGMNPDSVPKPLDGSVTVRRLPPARFAVLRYSGSHSRAKEAEMLGSLRTWLASQRLSGLPPPIYAYYDPPWIPSFLRRNEVMLRIDAVK